LDSDYWGGFGQLDLRGANLEPELWSSFWTMGIERRHLRNNNFSLVWCRIQWAEIWLKDGLNLNSRTWILFFSLRN
jgi:hypothetical protein